MTRGNQRELARAKNLKKQQAAAKGKTKESGMDKTKRMERDAEIMRQKQLKKQQAKEGGGESSKK